MADRNPLAKPPPPPNLKPFKPYSPKPSKPGYLGIRICPNQAIFLSKNNQEVFIYIGVFVIKVWLFLDIPRFFERLRNTLPNLAKPLLEGIQPCLFFLSLIAGLILGGSEMGVYRFLSPISSGYHH
jgi:hypothetical protein